MISHSLRDICKTFWFEAYFVVTNSQTVLFSRSRKATLWHQNDMVYMTINSLSSVASEASKPESQCSANPLDKLINDIHQRQTSKVKTPILIRNELQQNTSVHSLQKKEKVQKRVSVVEDKECSKNIEDLLRLGQVVDAVALLQKYAMVTRYPSRKTLLHLAAASSFAGNTAFIEKVGTICQKAFLKEFEWQMGYKHYIAEALWKTEQYKESIKHFEDLILRYPLQRKKISDMFKFLVQEVVQKKLRSELEMLADTVDVCANKGINHPGANAWFEMFTSEWPYAHYLCHELPRHHSDMKNFIMHKVDSVIRRAIHQNDTDMIQRLIDLIQHLDMSSQKSKVFSALMEIYCNNDDIVGAAETFRHIRIEGIIMYGSTCQRFMSLLNRHQQPTSLSLLHMKYNASGSYSPPKFLF